MGVARHFDGSEQAGAAPPNDYIISPSVSDSFNGITLAGWFKRDSTGTKNGLAGRLFGVNNGWSFFIDEFNNFCFRFDSTQVSVASPDLSEWTFLACTYDGTIGTPQVKFYAGTNADNIAEIGSANATGSFAELGAYGYCIGWVTFGGLLSIDSWNGSLDQVGIWYGAQTLPQLKDAALCGGRGNLSAIRHILDITGDNPEPSVVSMGASGPGFTVVGTTIVTGVPVGCDFAIPEDPPPPEGEAGEGQIRVTQVRKFYAWRIGPVVPDAACVFIPVIRILRAVDFLPVMELDAYATCRYTRRWTDLDDFDLHFSCDTEQGLRLAQILKPSDGSKQNGKYLVAVAFFQLIDFVGWIDRIKCFKGGGRHEMTISGYGLDRILSDRVLAPAIGAEFDAYDDPVETIIKTMVDRHIKTPGTFTTMIPGFNEAAREVPQVLIAADKELGPTVVYNGRFQKLIDGVREVIQAAEGELGYTLQLVQGIILFDVVPGIDKSLSIVFSPDYDNVSEFEWEHDGLNFCSQVVLGGQGTGTAKLLQSVYTTESFRFNIERREAYLDSADADTLAKLTDKGTSYLEDKGKVEIVRIKKLPGSRPCYKEDWDLGDIVGLRDSQYGINQASRVMEVTVSCAAGQVTSFDLVLAKASPIGPLSQLSSLRQGATGAVARQ